MSRYDDLDARTGLEQTVARDLRSALAKRGFEVVHKGHTGSHAPAGLPDIEASDPNAVFTFETTKSKGAQQDRELNSIRDHLNGVKANNPHKRCYCVFVSPLTSPRMLDAIRDHNRQRANEGKTDTKILPLCFDTLELWIRRLRDSEADLYPVSGFLTLFDYYTEFIDDLRVRKLLVQNVFPADAGLAEDVDREETERDQRTLERLIKDLARMEDYMRQNGIAVGHAAIDTLIYLVFLKLYEEKRERNGKTNRLRSPQTFEGYRRDSVAEPTRNDKRAVHQLFDQIKCEGEFLTSGMFTQGDTLPDSVNDDFVVNYVIPMFREYNFLGTRIDALGAVYEVLALRAEKDVKVGQFFTPENVVRFMVRLADPDYKDMVLDPACGTGRFLIHAMIDMLAKVGKSTARNKQHEQQQVRLHRLFGADVDQRIAKIARMNMWIHGDGKSNIFGGPDYNGLTLHKHAFNDHDSFDNAFDIVLTNPPLGDLNYQSIDFATGATAEQKSVSQNLERMPILPRKNLTEERLATVRKRLEIYRGELTQLEQQIAARQGAPASQRLRSAAERKRGTIQQNEAQATELHAKLRAGQAEWEITGNTMKGGALFLAAIWHYLKGNSYHDSPPEWRGGKILTILDEGVLNTDNYSPLREFLRSHFYIKAIISLTRDTFVPVSKTSTKTSILYGVKKTDLNAVQKEPIFFGHVEHVGLDTKGKVCANDLEPLLEKYFHFKRKVLGSYAGAEFRKERFLAQGFQGESL